MQYRTLGKTGWKVSAIGLGTWNIGGQWGPVPQEQAIATVRAALDEGVNFVDTADAYGEPQGLSEELIGRALEGRREGVYLATKVGNWGRRFNHPLPYTSPLHVQVCCEASLWRLRTDQVDLLQCHIGALEEPDIFLEAFETLQKQGKIRAFGVSTDSLKVLKAFNRDGRCASVQVNYNLLEREVEKELLPYGQEANVGVLVRGPLAKGLLAGKYDRNSTFSDGVRLRWNEGEAHERYLEMVEKVERLRFLAARGRTMAQGVLAFVLAHPAVTAAIPGAKSPEQARANAAAADLALSAEELAKARDVTA